MNDNSSTHEIENYLGGDMSPGEKKNFEDRLNTDPELRALYELYTSIDAKMRDSEKNLQNEEALKTTLTNLNQSYFKAAVAPHPEPVVLKMETPQNNHHWLRKLLSAAAVVAIIVAAIYWMKGGKNDSPQQLADNYVSTALVTLSQTMSSTTDSLQQGIAAYNDKNYSQALGFFQEIYKNHPENNEALKNAGITLLVTKQYDQAIGAFDDLAAKDLQSNAGLFFKAVTLMQRNAGTDKEDAKKILQQVVDEKQDKSEIAVGWLQKWK